MKREKNSPLTFNKISHQRSISFFTSASDEINISMRLAVTFPNIFINL